MGARSDIAELLAAACAQPHERSLRRVLADALLADDHPLGTFVQAQLAREDAEAARCMPQPVPSPWEQQHQRAAVDAWFALLPSLRPLRSRPVQLVGGLIGAVSVKWEQLRSPSWLGGVALEHLDITNPAPPDGIALLEALPGRSRLRSLNVSTTGLEDRGMISLSELQWPELRWLDLKHNRIGERGAKALLVASAPKLALVDFGGNRVSPCERAFDAEMLGAVWSPDGRFYTEPDIVLETEMSEENERAWRSCGEPPWARVLWRHGRELPHRFNLWDSVPESARAMEGAVLLRGHIGRADLRGSQWTGANLAATTFDGTDLRGANLGSVNLDFAWLSDVDLSGAVAPSLQMRRAHLKRCDLSRANLRNAIFEETLFEDCQLSHADLSCDTDYHHMGRTRRTQLIRCDLRGASWHRRELIGAHLVDCQTEGIEGVPWSTEGALVERAGIAGPLSEILGRP